MTAPDPRELLAVDAPLAPLPGDLGPRVRARAMVRRRSRRLMAVTAGAAVIAAGAVAMAPRGSGGAETLTPAPMASQPSDSPSEGLAEGEALPELDAPPCVHADGYRRIYGVPGEKRGPERLQDSVQEDMSLGVGFVPEVERALVDTAPSGAVLDCASAGTVVFVVGTDGSYIESRSALVNPRHAGERPEYFSRGDVETYATPDGARVRLEASGTGEVHLEIWAGRYDVSVGSRTSNPGSAGLPEAAMRAWGDRLGDRLMEESNRRGEVPVDLIDRTPNPPPQEVVDHVLAAAPEGAQLLGPDASSSSQAERIAILHPDGRAAAVVFVGSTTHPRQASPMTAMWMREVAGADLEDERHGWPSGLLVGVDRLHNQILIQHEDRVFLNFSGDDQTVVSRERLRRWAMDVVRTLE